MFTIGQRVIWTSQAAGIAKTKEGVIVAVVPARQRPDRDQFTQLYTGPGVGSPRPAESYVVKVGTRLYWPRVSALVPAPATHDPSTWTAWEIVNEDGSILARVMAPDEAAAKDSIARIRGSQDWVVRADRT